MNPYPQTEPQEAPQIASLEAEIDTQKDAIREACLRLGRAYYDAHREDPATVMEPDVRLILDATAQIKTHEAQLRELKGLVLCPQCHSEISKNILFCNLCGHRMKEPEPAPETPSACDACGQPLRPGQKFCTGCGKPVASMVAKPQKIICSGCGTELTDDAKFCFECGTPVG